MICIFKLEVCCGCGQFWKLISLISTDNKDTINKIITDDDNNTIENINNHTYYGKRNDDIIIKDYKFNYWYVVEEINVIN